MSSFTRDERGSMTPIHQALALVTAPSTEPLTSTEAKLHIREDCTDQDTLITAIIKAARQYGEAQTGRAFVTQTWSLKLDAFPVGEIAVPKPPLQSVTSITYVDTTGTTATMDAADYRVDASSEPGRITPAWGTIWPSTREVTGAVTVQFVAGYGAAAAVPEDLRAAMKLHIGDLYENREESAVGTVVSRLRAVEDLYNHYRVEWVG